MHVLYLERTFFDFYIGGTENVLRFDFSPATTNIEITNKDEFENQIKAFITANTIAPSGIIIILSEGIAFAKTIPSDEKADTATSAFLDTVPFEHIASRIYPIQGGRLVVGVNRDFFETIKEGFLKVGFSTEAVVPVFVANLPSLNPQVGLDPASAKAAIAAVESLKTITIAPRIEFKPRIATQTESHEHPHSDSKPAEKKNNNRAFLLAGVFGILLIIMVVMFLQMQASNASLHKPAPTPTPQATAPLAKAEEKTLGAETSTYEDIHITVQTNLQTPSESAFVRSLKDQGFTVEEKLVGVVPEKTTVLFPSSITSTVRGKLLELLSLVSSSFLVQNTNSESHVIIITLGD